MDWRRSYFAKGMKALKKKYPSQSEETWIKISSAVPSFLGAEQSDRPMVIFVVLPIGAPESFCEALALTLNSCWPDLRSPRILKAQDLNNSNVSAVHGGIDKYLETGKIVIITDMMNIKQQEHLYMLHSLCDNDHSRHKNAAFIFTANINEKTDFLSHSTVEEKIRELLHKNWEIMPYDKRAATIARVTPVTLCINEDQINYDVSLIHPVSLSVAKAIYPDEFIDKDVNAPSQLKWKQYLSAKLKLTFEDHWTPSFVGMKENIKIMEEGKLFSKLPASSWMNMTMCLDSTFDPQKHHSVTSVLLMVSPLDFLEEQNVFLNTLLLMNKNAFGSSVRITEYDSLTQLGEKLDGNYRQRREHSVIIIERIDQEDNLAKLGLIWYFLRQGSPFKNILWILTMQTSDIDDVNYKKKAKEQLNEKFSQLGVNVDKFVTYIADFTILVNC